MHGARYCCILANVADECEALAASSPTRLGKAIELRRRPHRIARIGKRPRHIESRDVGATHRERQRRRTPLAVCRPGNERDAPRKFLVVTHSDVSPAAAGIRR